MRYERPDRLTKSVFNPIMMLLTRVGIGPRGARTLAVRGRKSGEWRTVPVNPLTLDGRRYLVAPRGETEWVRNIRAAGGGELRLGSRREAIRVAELSDDGKPPVLRGYLKNWKMETGKFFGGMTAESSEEELRGIAPRHPVFRILEDAIHTSL